MVADGPLRTVAVLTEVAALDRVLDYLVPDGFEGPTEPGSRVRVELHGRSVRGWIMGEGTEDPRSRTLKPLRSSLGIGPPASMLELIEWAAWRWYGVRSRFFATASPAHIVRKLPVRPGVGTLEIPESPLGQLGAARVTMTQPGLLRLGPTTDPFDVVLGFLAGLAADGSLEAGSALVLVPGIDYAARLVARLSRRGIPVVEAASSWEAARAGWPVVVGTRAAAFAPVPSVAGVLLLDVDDERFVSEAAPTWRAEAVALERARHAGVPSLLVASCPSAIEQLGCELLEVEKAVERSGWPVVALADRRADDPRTGLLTEHLVEAARAALEAQPSGVAVACLVNRTGRARLLVCARCEAIARCESCDAAMVLDDQLHCPRCAKSRPVICQGCGATKLKLLRLGTAQLAPELGRLLGVPVAELTAASDTAALEGARAVVGTEAILFRLRRTSLVVFLDLDHHLLAPRVGAELRGLRLIGRAGRLVGGRVDEGAGKVLLQTRLTDHLVVVAAQQGDPTAVLEADAALRAELGLPPTRALATLRGEGAESFAAQLAAGGLEVAPLGAGSHAVLAPDAAALCDALAGATRPKGRLVVSVDVESL